MPRMVHPDAPEPYDTVTDDQADVLRANGWKSEAQATAAKTRRQSVRAAKRPVKKAATAPPTTSGSKPADNEKE